MKDDKVGSRHVDQHLLGFYRSRRFKAWLVPTRFFAGRLKVCVNPWGPATEVNWDIPSELATFTPHTYPQLSKPNPVSPSTRGSRPKPGAIFKPDWLSPVWPFMPFVLALLICIGILWGQIFISADPQETRIQTGENNMAIRGLLIVFPLFWLLLLPIQSRFPEKLQVNLSRPLWVLALLWAGAVALPAVAARDVGAFADMNFSTAFPGTATFGLWPDEWSSLFNRNSSAK